MARWHGHTWAYAAHPQPHAAPLRAATPSLQPNLPLLSLPHIPHLPALQAHHIRGASRARPPAVYAADRHAAADPTPTPTQLEKGTSSALIHWTCAVAGVGYLTKRNNTLREIQAGH